MWDVFRLGFGNWLVIDVLFGRRSWFRKEERVRLWILRCLWYSFRDVFCVVSWF